MENAFLDKVDYIEEHVPEIKQILTDIEVVPKNVLLEILPKVLVDILNSGTANPDELDLLAQECKIRLDDIQEHCQKMREDAAKFLQNNAENKARADAIVGEAFKQRKLLRDNPKDYLRKADEKLIKFERDLEIARTA